MRFSDRFKLILQEYKYEKMEWIVSSILQCLIFTSVLFLLTLSSVVDRICGDYIAPLHDEGFFFQVDGYTESDIAQLDKMGFRNIVVDSYGEVTSAYIDDLDGIWLKKIKAVFDGKDIVNKDLEETLLVTLFCQVTLGAIGVILFITMLNNLSNSFEMKLMRRRRYITMLIQLGCVKKIVKSIYYGFFSIRNVAALVLAVGTNSFLIAMLNRYMKEKMYINSPAPLINIGAIVCILLVSLGLMWISFSKQWRQMNEG